MPVPNPWRGKFSYGPVVTVIPPMEPLPVLDVLIPPVPVITILPPVLVDPVPPVVVLPELMLKSPPLLRSMNVPELLPELRLMPPTVGINSLLVTSAPDDNN